MTLTAPFPWFGGKRRVAHLVWPRLGVDVANYVEPFFGSGAVLLARPGDPRIETVNDLDCHIANFWRAVQRDPEQVAYHADWPINEADLHARHQWLVDTTPARAECVQSDPEYFDAKVAGWWVWGLCQWIGSGWCRVADERRPDLHSAGFGVHRKRPIAERAGRGVHQTWHRSRRGGFGRGVHRQLPDLNQHHGRGLYAEGSPALVEWMGDLCQRLRHVRVCCGDWPRVLGATPTYLVGTTAVFLDPPYSLAERSHDSRRIYAHDGNVAAATRDWAVANGDNPRLRIALCGYEGEHAMPAAWSAVRWKAPGGYGSQANGVGRRNAHRETIWFSPHCLDPQVGQHPLDFGEAAG